jgi:hypothetical protein
VRPEGLCQRKIPMTPPGIDPAPAIVYGSKILEIRASKGSDWSALFQEVTRYGLV